MCFPLPPVLPPGFPPLKPICIPTGIGPPPFVNGRPGTLGCTTWGPCPAEHGPCTSGNGTSGDGTTCGADAFDILPLFVIPTGGATTLGPLGCIKGIDAEAFDKVGADNIPALDRPTAAIASPG